MARALTTRQRVVLKYICRRPDCSMKELAGELGCKPNAASSLAQTLKINGYLQRPNGFKRFALTRAGVEELTA